MYFPVEKGKDRLVNLIYWLDDHLETGTKYILPVKDGRRFYMEAGERQYRMGMLGFGVFENFETEVIKQYLHAGDCVIDAGANIGWFTTIMSEIVGAKGSVHSFEPIPHSFEILKLNCQLDNAENVVLNNIGLAAEEGEVDFFMPDSGASGDAGISTMENKGSAGRTIRCKLTTLDSYFLEKGIKKCNFIKIDVEGSELLLVSGALNTISDCRPNILIEINPETLSSMKTNGRQVLEKLLLCGKYQFFEIGSKGSELKKVELHDIDSLSEYINILAIADDSKN
jgi:FkbM family methyltransferase